MSAAWGGGGGGRGSAGGESDSSSSSGGEEEEAEVAEAESAASGGGGSGEQRLMADSSGDGPEKPKRPRSSRSKASAHSATKRARARTRAEHALSMVHLALKEQSAIFEEVQPCPLPQVPRGVKLEQAEKKRIDAYAQLAAAEKTYCDCLAQVRASEAVLNPVVARCPAVFGVAVSAPSTTWAVEDWTSSTPLPDLASSLKRSFLAAFSYADPAKNRIAPKYKKAPGVRKKSRKEEAEGGGSGDAGVAGI